MQNIVFRVDVSNQIGTGHLMRCLTLADALFVKGAKIRFVCRHIPEVLVNVIEEKQHDLILLAKNPAIGQLDDPVHAHWLGTTQVQDAKDTLEALLDKVWDWLIVDHYALDSRWETSFRSKVKKIMVIDDLADREHDCDLLLDQNCYADMETRYNGKVPQTCQLLLGPRYALIRNEFKIRREHIKPSSGKVKRIFVFFGGIDAVNHTAKVIEALSCLKSYKLIVDVVVGSQHPFKRDIEASCTVQGFHCHVQTNRMAELMAAADLAIGACGFASYEFAAMSLPSIQIPTTEIQAIVAKELERLGVTIYMGKNNAFSGKKELIDNLIKIIGDEKKLNSMAKACESLFKNAVFGSYIVDLICGA